MFVFLKQVMIHTQEATNVPILFEKREEGGIMADEITQPAQETPIEGVPVETPSTGETPAQPIIQTINPADAQAILTQEKKDRENRCLQRIIAVLQEENCKCDPHFTILGDKIVNNGITVTAYDRKEGV